MAVIIRPDDHEGPRQRLYTTSFDQRFLVVGLGNPGSKYERSRHNLGFLCLDQAVAAYGGSWRKQADWQALVAEIDIAGQHLVALKPQTFMNLSGQAVGPALRFYQLEPAAMLVIHDALEETWGTIALAQGGGSRGHRGIKSLREVVGDQANFKRCKLGIGPKPPDWELTDFVLGDLSPRQWQELPLIQQEVSSLLGSLGGGGFAAQKINVLSSLNGN